MLMITVNGQPHTLPGAATIAQLLEKLGFEILPLASRAALLETVA